MTETENKVLYIAEECRKAGMTLAGAAGVIANIEVESAFKSDNVQDSYESRVGNDEAYTAKVDNGIYHDFTRDAAGYGLAQWTAGDRKANMLAYFRQRGKSIGDFGTQVDFLIHEMRGYSRAWNTCTGSNDPYECGYNVCKYYEIPANTETQAQYRGSLARKWYDWLAKNAGAAPDPIPSTDEEGIPVEKTWPPRTVDLHCSGWPEIWMLQGIMKCRGYSVTVDGIWHKDLTKAVKKFQKSQGLQDDGCVGEKTWASLMKI